MSNLLSIQEIVNSANFTSADGAGLLRVSTANVGTFAGDAVNNRVSAFQNDAGNLMTSTKSNDGALLRSSSLPAPMATYWTSAFDIATAGGVAVVNGASSKIIKIYGMNMTYNASGATKWQSGATDLQGITRLSASAGYVAFVNPPAYVIATTSAGQDLNLNLSATGVSASGWVAGWSE